MFSILLGGGLFGFAGMLLGVPVFAVIYYIVKTFTEWLLRRKNLPVASSDYCTVEYINKNNMLIYQKGAEEKDGLFKKIRKKEKETEEKEKKE